MPEEGVLDNHIDTQNNAEAESVTVGVSEHDKEMIEKADTGLDENSENIQKSEEKLFAGKYKNEGELNKGVTELLKMQHPEMSVEEIYKGLESGKLVPSSAAADANDNADADKGNQQTEAKTPEMIAAEKVIADKAAADKAAGVLPPIDPVALSLERDENEGQLTQDTRDRLLNDYKIPESTLDTYLAGLSAMEELFVGKVYDLTGGEENYKGMVSWMQENMTEAELNAFDDQLATQDIVKVTAAVEGMSARFKEVNGSQPSLIRPGGNLQSNVSGAYSSKAEWLADVKNPEYDKNPAFRQQVIAKLAKNPNLQ